MIFCDDQGGIVDGDRIIGMVALYYQRRGRLAGGAAVVTVMSNLGLVFALRDAGIGVITTDVGDHKVIEAMRENRCNIGGEKSGHVIFLDYVTTGDGIITALHVLEQMKRQDRTLREAAAFMCEYPQLLVNLAVTEKRPVEEMEHLQLRLREMHDELGNSGRALIRYSGTENKLRILVETRESKTTERWSAKLVEAAKKDLDQ